MKYQGELSIVGACEGYSKTPAKHAPAVGNSVLNSPINNLGSGSVSYHRHIADVILRREHERCTVRTISRAFNRRHPFS
jgi:hypothetical protein